MEACVEFSSISANQLKQWTNEAIDFAFSTGFCIRLRHDPRNYELVNHAPFMLFPSPIPRHGFQKVVEIQETANLLMHKVAHDHEFLTECFQSALEVDDFTKKLWNIYTTVRKEGISQPISLAMNRNDYMFDSGHLDGSINPSRLKPKQIEFNTMASSMHGLSQQLNKLHRHVLQISGNKDKISNIPANNCNTGLAEAVVKAWEMYNNPQSVVLMLVMDPETNIFDQRHLEYEIISQNQNIKVIRRSLQDMTEHATLGDNKELTVDGMEVSVVYFRVGYVPQHLDIPNGWETRLLIERSRAIKCPNIQYFLAGMKKVQQMLSLPGRVEKYITDPAMVQSIRETFAEQYTLDSGDEGTANIEKMLADPDRYVIKPQREGGGNNFYGDGIPTLLNNIKDTDERNAYIGMDRIHPPPFKNVYVCCGLELTVSTVVSELGIYGSLVGTATEIYHNKQHGFNLRTKALGTDEGGVAAGCSALDTAYLVD